MGIHVYRRVSVKCIQEIPVDTRKSIRRNVSTIEELMIKCDVFFCECLCRENDSFGTKF